MRPWLGLAVTLTRTRRDSDSGAGRQVDPDDPAQRTAVEDFWRWAGACGRTRPFATGKTYK